MALDRVLCCKKSKIWLPDEFLTTIVGDCDRGKFLIKRTYELPAAVMPNGHLYIEEQDGHEVTKEEFDLTQVTCAKCNGEVEFREIDIRETLDKLRQREITMKERQRERESRKLDKQAMEAEREAFEKQNKDSK